MLPAIASPRPWPSVVSSRRTPRRGDPLEVLGRAARAVVLDRQDHAVAVARRDQHARTAPTCRRCRAGCRTTRASLRGRRGTGSPGPCGRRCRAGDRDTACAGSPTSASISAVKASATPGARPPATRARRSSLSMRLRRIVELLGQLRAQRRDALRMCSSSAMCVNTVSGAFSAWARLPSDSRERCSRRASSASRRLTSRTRGRTSAGTRLAELRDLAVARAGPRRPARGARCRSARRTIADLQHDEQREHEQRTPACSATAARRTASGSASGRRRRRW